MQGRGFPAYPISDKPPCSHLAQRRDGSAHTVQRTTQKSKPPDTSPPQTKTTPGSRDFLGSLEWNGRHDLLSHRVAPAVPSACQVLTSEFGMGSGVAPALSSPAKAIKKVANRNGRSTKCQWQGHPSVFGEKAKRVISTGQLNALLRLHLPPINQVVFLDPSGRAHLEGGFPLRCFQRLSRPHVATRQCRWRDNRNTRGVSIPVLSY